MINIRNVILHMCTMFFHEDMPFQQVPVLEVDGKDKVCGHVNIARYIAEKHSEYSVWIECFVMYKIIF